MAIKRWVGGAVAVADVWTITVANTWASGDTVTISIGTKDLIITLGGAASTAVADIATEIKNAINATSNASPGTGFTWSHGGQQFAEFTELVTATSVGPVVTLTGATPGDPIGLVVTEVTAGSGTATEANTIPATGPNHIDNPDNYAGGVLPVDDDDLYFDTGEVSALYGLTYFRANNIDLNVYISSDWTGALGLPLVRTNDAGSYGEYRQRYFQMRGGSKVLQILPGLNGTEASAGNLYIDLQDQDTTTISILGLRGSGLTPSVFLCGSHASTPLPDMVIVAGNVSIEPDDAPTAAGKHFLPGDITVGTKNSALTDCIVTVGKNARLTLGDVLYQNGGTVKLFAATKSGADVMNGFVYGGSLELASAGDEATFEIHEGAYLYPTGAGGAITQVKCMGTMDWRRHSRGKSCSDVKLYAGASYFQPTAVGGDGVHLVGCSPDQLEEYQFPANREIDWSATATP